MQKIPRSSFSKYRNVKPVINGIKFDSAKEARRYNELLLLERAGEITGLQRQVKFCLIPSQRRSDGKLERQTDYIADFVYFEGKNRIVEDVKGYKKGNAYALFVIKRKLMLQNYSIEIKEV